LHRARMPTTRVQGGGGGDHLRRSDEALHACNEDVKNAYRRRDNLLNWRLPLEEGDAERTRATARTRSNISNKQTREILTLKSAVV